MKTLTTAIFLLLLTGCAVRATENDVARWHGFRLSERVPENEKRPDERCYSHGAAVYCYLLGLETDGEYRIERQP